MAVLPPSPFYAGDPEAFELATDIDDVWYCRLRMLFRCTFRPTAGPNLEDIPLELALVTTFEDFPNQGGLAESAGCKLLYDPTPIPCVYVLPASHVLCRVPLMPFFMHGNIDNTVPHTWSGSENQDAGLRKDPRPVAQASHQRGRGGARLGAHTGQKKGSRLYQVNVWLWQFGRPVPRLCTVQDTEERRNELWQKRGEASKRSRLENRRVAAANKRRRITRNAEARS